VYCDPARRRPRSRADLSVRLAEGDPLLAAVEADVDVLQRRDRAAVEAGAGRSCDRRAERRPSEVIVTWACEVPPAPVAVTRHEAAGR
jgi:hypothetical protein